MSELLVAGLLASITLGVAGHAYWSREAENDRCRAFAQILREAGFDRDAAILEIANTALFWTAMALGACGVAVFALVAVVVL